MTTEEETLEQKASEENNAQDYEDRNDDDLNETHDRSPRLSESGEKAILIAVATTVNAFICKELLIHLGEEISRKLEIWTPAN